MKVKHGRLSSDYTHHLDKQGDYHERLIHRLTLALPGIRPAFIPKDGERTVRELSAFDTWYGMRMI